MNKCYYGIDFGGSSLKVVCANDHGKILRSKIARAGGNIPRDELVLTAHEALMEIAGGESLGKIGLAFGGAIQPDGTMLPDSTNLPNIANIKLVEFFERQFSAKVKIENDARAAMRGEAWSGAARDLKNAMTITFGTGIGSGLMLDGKIRTGSNGTAGEIGIWTFDDSDLTFEDICAPGRVERTTGQRFDDMFNQGKANTFLANTGRAIANAHLLLDLEAVILLGGITELGEHLRAAIEETFHANCPLDYRGQFTIRLGEHGDLAGAVGAASLWQDQES
jgi:predicted NBD/HSP70 family sugar kinase